MADTRSNFDKNKKKIIKKYGTSDSDTGSPQVQIALMTKRIDYLVDHLKNHKKDKHSRRGLVKLVNDRKKMVDYYTRNTEEKVAKKFLKDMNLA